jgi:hypothetical protein
MSLQAENNKKKIEAAHPISDQPFQTNCSQNIADFQSSGRNPNLLIP